MIPLVLIEVQSGKYLGEDDIVRFEDHYGREKRNGESQGLYSGAAKIGWISKFRLNKL